MKKITAIVIAWFLILLFSCTGAPKESSSFPEKSKNNEPEDSIDSTSIQEGIEIEEPENKELPDPSVVIDSSLPSNPQTIDKNMNHEELALPEINGLGENAIITETATPTPQPVSNPDTATNKKPFLTPPPSQPDPTSLPTQTTETKPQSPTAAPKNNDQEAAKKSINQEAENNNSMVETREVTALVGDDILITFNHEGWIFLGYKNPGDDLGILYVNRESRSDETLFTFEAAKLGKYQLDFTYQDNFMNLFQKQEVIVHIVNEGDLGKNTEKDIFSDYTFSDAEDFFKKGDYASAMEIVQSLPETPENNELAARISEKQGEFSTALSYWEKNLTAVPPYHSHASEAVARIKINQGDVKDLIQNWSTYVPDDSRLSRETLIDLLKNIDNSDYNLESIEPLVNMVNNPLLRLDQPEIYYLLGRIHEKEGPLRNFQRAKEYYQLLIQLYPVHNLSELSQARINYINRYFILFQ